MTILVHTLYQGFRTWGPLVADVTAPRVAVGLRPIEPERFGPDVLDRASCVLAAVTPGLDEPGTVPPNTTYVGPILRPRQPDAVGANDDGVGIAPDRPTILVSFGSTVQRQHEALPPVLEAIAGLPVAAVLALGGVIAVSTVSAGPNVVVHDRLAFDRILPRIAAVVCHGGLSTIQESLAAGVPLVVIPQGRDQTDNAARVAATGAGLELPRDADPAVIGAAIRRGLDEPTFRATPGRFAAAIDELGAGAVATGLVEGLIGRRVDSSPDRMPLANAQVG